MKLSKFAALIIASGSLGSSSHATHGAPRELPLTGIEKENYDTCLKDAQEKYDSCIELAHQMLKNGPDHTREFKTAHELINGGCKKKHDADLMNCKAQFGSRK